MDTKFCKKCGKQIDGDSEFCTYCGEKQGSSTEPIKNNFENKTTTIKTIIIIIVVALFVIGLLTAMGIIYISTNYKPANTVESITSTVTISTETTTTATETTTADENRIEVECYNDKFSVVVPDDWVYEIMDNQICFYEKYNYTNMIEDTNTGFLGCIATCTEDELDEYPNHTVLGKKNGTVYFFSGLTGFGVADDQLANTKFKKALEEVDSFTKTFEFSKD